MRALIRTWHHRDFDVEALVATKGEHVVSVCLPARDEEATVGRIVESIRHHLLDGVGLVDEIVVIDDHSSDQTARVAADAGARVLSASTLLIESGPGEGKGDALWKSVYAAAGDVIAWCDADIVDFDPRFVVGLVGPLLTSPDVQFVKGFYERPDDDGRGGGRVTELVARPLLALLFPHLAGIVQPLGGEYAARRSVLERVPFVQGYGVDLGLLVDVSRQEGTEALAQVDLGVRKHRNRSLEELGPQALAVLQTALARAGHIDPSVATVLAPAGREPVTVTLAERPPLAAVPAYRRRSA